MSGHLKGKGIALPVPFTLTLSDSVDRPELAPAVNQVDLDCNYRPCVA